MKEKIKSCSVQIKKPMLLLQYGLLILAHLLNGLLRQINSSQLLGCALTGEANGAQQNSRILIKKQTRLE